MQFANKWGLRGFAGAVVASACVATPARAGWTAPAKLNTPDDTPRRVSFPRIAPATNGGFHVVYQAWDDQNAAGRAEYLRYRRFNAAGAVAAPVTILESGGVNKPDVATAPNGDVHVVWENWNGGPEIAWSRSTNGGASFSSGVNITTVNDGFGARLDESPQIAGFGTSGGQAVVTWRNTGDNSLEFQKFDGTNWTGYSWTGHFATGFNAPGIARNPVTGNVHKMVDTGPNAGYKTFEQGAGWGSTFDVFSADQAVEPSMAINAAGQQMFLIDNNFVSKAQLVNPNGSHGTFNSDLFAGRRNFGAVTAIPGTNDFFAVATDAMQAVSNQSTHIFGRRYTGGAWGPIETLATMSEVPEFISNIDVAADPLGNVLVTWQYNIKHPGATGEQTQFRPNVYYTINVVPEPATGASLLLLAALPLVARRKR
jgi:hypothetical protein